jgi:ethanolamine ammonia-lyase small subunit
MSREQRARAGGAQARRPGAFAARRAPSFLRDLVVSCTAPAIEAASPPPAPSPSALRAAPTGIASPHDAELLARIVASTPCRVATGRTGTRYRTDTYLEIRADHAIAKDAVYASLPDDLAERLACVPVLSRCTSREDYLLHPNRGRRLSDESRALLERRGTRGADVLVIVADGLAAPALLLNGPVLLPALIEALGARGLRTGTPILARMARVGLQDDIGVLLGARATAICLGERPGLGTGDSLSIYIAVGPKLDQDNAEKNCISNIRPQGMRPEAAAVAAADLLARGIAAGRGGLALAQESR